MPRGKKSQGQKKTRAAKRRGRGNRQLAPVQGQRDIAKLQNGFQPVHLMRPRVGGFAPVMRTTLRYVSNINLNPSASTASFVFNLTNMYDPDVTSTGHQPTNFDLFSQVYKQYAVERARWKMTWISGVTTNLSPAYYGVYFNVDGNRISGSTATNDLMEQSFVMYGAYGAGANTQANPGSIQAAIDTKTFFAQSGRGFRDDPNNWALTSAGPANAVYAEMWASPINGNTPSSALTFLIEIEFDAIWREPKNTTFSTVDELELEMAVLKRRIAATTGQIDQLHKQALRADEGIRQSSSEEKVPDLGSATGLLKASGKPAAPEAPEPSRGWFG